MNSLLSLFDYNIDNKLISVVGAGGKTSFLEVFLDEFESGNRKEKKLLLTSTTKMYNNYSNAIIENNISNIVNHIKDKNTYLIFKSIDKDSNKLIGYSPKEIDKIYLSKTFNTIISESDGASSLQIKAHNENEPSNPFFSTDIVAIFSLDAIGKNVVSVVHRKDIFTSITGVYDILTKESITKLIMNNNNYFKNTNEKAKRHIVFSKADLIDNSTLKYLFEYFSSEIKNVCSISFCSLLKDNPKISFQKFY